MSKFGKFKSILAIGATVAKPFAPGAVNSILDIVNQHIDNKDPVNSNVYDALKTLATDNDEQTQAIFALHERIKILESKIK